MTYGLTDTGFNKKPLDVILENVTAKQLSRLGAGLDLSTDSPMGQMNGIVCAELAELWDTLEAILSSVDPDANTGVAQDAIAAITGSLRDGATRSEVVVSVNLNAGVTLVPGVDMAAPLGAPSSLFTPLEEITNTGGSPATVTGTFASVDTGPIVANAGGLTVIMTPKAGWNSITNAEDAVLGAPIETDSAFRAKREAELNAQGASTPDAIRADLLQVEGIIQCKVFQNLTNATDADGLPPHSVECLIFDGETSPLDDDDIAQAVWDCVAGGIETHGNTTGTAVDEAGESHTVYFSRPTQVPIYMALDLTINSLFPGSGDTLIQDALALKGSASQVGDDVILVAFYGPIFGVAGVANAVLHIGLAPSPSGTVDLTIGSRELAVFDTARITITHV